MIYQIIAVCVASAIAGIKKPIYGGLTGAILSPIVHLLFYKFDLTIFFILFPVGFAIGTTMAGITNWFFCGAMDDKNRKPYYTSIHMPGGNTGSGIVYTEEEEKNAKQNEDKNC